MTTEPRYFIPVCLYPHTKYRTAAGLMALFDKYALGKHDHLMVVADRLLVLDRLVSGRYWTVTQATSKARQEAKQVLSLINRISIKTGARPRGTVVFWDEIAETARYAEFSRLLLDAVLSDRLLSESIHEFAERRVKRFSPGSAPEREQGYEREYLLSEVSMSVFCTEILGFSNEVWERPPQPGAPDPLKLLYEQRRELIPPLTGREASRVLSFLFADSPSEAKAI